MTLFRNVWVTLVCGLLGLSACSASEEPAFDPAASPYFSADDSLIDLDGQRIRYRQTGADDGQAVILLHGFTDSLHTWDIVADGLEDTFRVIRPDLPGHGLSGAAPSADYSNEALVDFVDDFIEETGADAPIVVGNSLGGLAAWRYAANAPNKVSGLVLLAPGGVPHNDVGETPIPVPAMLGYYLKNAPEAGVTMALKAMHADPDTVTEAQVQQYRDMMTMPGNGAAFMARAEQFTLPDPAAQMAKVTSPVTVIWGEQDGVLPPSHAEIFIKNMPQASSIILPGTGHMPQSEAPDVVIDAIKTLAASLESTP